jgi:predicted HTH transcriptional regulator
MDDTFRINLYRYSDDANGANHDANGANGANHDAYDANRDANDANRDANDAKQKDQGIITKILTILSANPKITQYELASKLGISRATTQRIMKTMTDEHLITRVGSTRGYWQISHEE